MKPKQGETSEIVFWSCDDSREQLSCTDIDEAIELHLDSMYPTAAEDLPKTISAYGYRRMAPTLRDCGSVLDDLVERLDEEYGNPDGPEGITVPMRKAEATFLEAILAEYTPWACEIAETHTVNVSEWVREHRPDWVAA